MKASRKRNAARKTKSDRGCTGNVSAPLPQGSRHERVSVPAPFGFVSQNVPPAAAHREPEAGNGFVSQNRANAQYSTGPRTAEGKAASAQNAFKHGLSSQRHAVLSDEDPALYAQFLAELREIYEPLSRRKSLAVEDLAQCRCALARFDQAEAVCLEKLTAWRCGSPHANRISKQGIRGPNG